MNTLDYVKKEIKLFYDNGQEIHVNISISHPRVELTNNPAKITGVYSNLFRIEEYSKGTPITHTVKYSELLTKQIEITELKV